MPFTKYDLYALAALTLGILACAALWQWADVVYRSGSRVAGWRLGLLSCTLPALALAGYALWLRQQRALGHSAPQLRWLKVALALGVAFPVFMLLFSLM